MRLCEALASSRRLARHLDEPESRIEKRLFSHDQAITGIVEVIRQVMQSPQSLFLRPIGFVTPEESKIKPTSRSTKRT